MKDECKVDQIHHDLGEEASHDNLSTRVTDCQRVGRKNRGFAIWVVCARKVLFKYKCTNQCFGGEKIFEDGVEDPVGDVKLASHLDLVIVENNITCRGYKRRELNTTCQFWRDWEGAHKIIEDSSTRRLKTVEASCTWHLVQSASTEGVVGTDNRGQKEGKREAEGLHCSSVVRDLGVHKGHSVRR
jgi:hypothetical protein